MTITTGLSSIIPGARDRAGNDPIFALNHEANTRAKNGESILNATLGALLTDSGQLAVMPTVLDSIARVRASQAAGYAPISGSPAYREAVVADLFGDGLLARQAIAVATPGGTGAVYQSVVNFLEPGQKMLVPSYYWGPYREITRHSGRGMDTFQMFAPDGSFHMEAMASALDMHAATQQRVLIVLNFPCHNPTGYSLSPDEWRRAAETIQRVGERAPVTVLIDAAYLAFGGPAMATWANALPTLLRSCTVLVAWTASKSYCQYGARVGALVALHRDRSELRQIENALGYTCRATWSNCNHLGQLAVTELLSDPEKKGRCDEERAELTSLLQERVDAFNDDAAAAGLKTPRYDSGFFVAVFSRDNERTAQAMREVGVYVTPIPGAVRAALCATPLGDVARLVDALKTGVDAAGGPG